MNEVTAQFLITVSDVLEGARIAQLPVVARVGGDDVAGVPGSAGEGREVDDTGRGRRVDIGGVAVDLEEIEEITLRRPQAPSAPPVRRLGAL